MRDTEEYDRPSAVRESPFLVAVLALFDGHQLVNIQYDSGGMTNKEDEDDDHEDNRQRIFIFSTDVLFLLPLLRGTASIQSGRQRGDWRCFHHRLVLLHYLRQF